MAEEQAVSKTSSCILCSINCGLQIQTGGNDGREIIKVRGDKNNPLSKGYLCNKASRLNYYQMGADRLNTPMRRKADGSYEPVDWDTAITEVAAGLQQVRQQHGGDKILYVGGGGQGNHLGGIYADGLLKTLGVKYRTNALAQEKTGEFWVKGKMFGGGPHGDFEHAEVAVFIGKNPWQSHGFPRSRKVLKELSRDPDRALVVIDPCVTDTARIADYHLQVKPGTDAWCISALIAALIQEGLQDSAFIANHTSGYEQIEAHFQAIPVAEYARICEVDEKLIRATARRIASADCVSVFEDLGVQQNIHSTLVSYLDNLLYVLTGNFAKKGANNIAVPLLSLSEASKGKINAGGGSNKVVERKSPVLGSKVIIGLLPCSELPEEILTDHPNRFRAAIIESSNPVHSFANTPRMREAIHALEFSVVIDVAMTETAREASYVLPAPSSFEKYECVFFQIEFPKNYFQLRQPIAAPLPGTLSEPEIHTRLLEQFGVIKPGHIRLLRLAAKVGRQAFAVAFAGLIAARPDMMKVAPSLLYRSLGPTLDQGKAAAAAPFWGICHQFVRKHHHYASNAGFGGSRFQAAERLFNALLNSPSGLFFSDSSEYQDSWRRMKAPNGRIQLYLEELFPQLGQLDPGVLQTTPEFPFVLSAGQRRGETSNTIIRDAAWDRKNKLTSLYMHPEDAQQLALSPGDAVKITTKTGEAQTQVAITDTQRPGFVSLPNGTGLDYRNAQGQTVKVGIAPNELTSTEDRDPFAGTPWHKHVAARIEKIA